MQVAYLVGHNTTQIRLVFEFFFPVVLSYPISFPLLQQDLVLINVV